MSALGHVRSHSPLQMAADFWASSHYKRWIVDRATVRRARVLDLLYVDDPIYLDYFAIYFANVITKLGKKLGLRQRVIATATVFFRRFYLKNAYCETDPFLVIAACCYVAAKAEESPVHIKTVISEARSLFSQDMYGIKNFPTDNSKLAEMEFYLVDDLECDLTVFHPYRTLLTLCKKESELDTSATPAEEGEAGELGSTGFSTGHHSSGAGNLGVGIGADEGPRYWGTGEGKLELSTGALQTAWFIINDTYRSDICLLYPPHLIAISSIYLTFILHNPTRTLITPLLSSSSSPSPSTTATTEPEHQKPRRSTRNTSSSSSTSTTTSSPAPQDPITFLSELTISLPLISSISQEIISLYTLWDRYKEDAHPEAKTPSLSHSSPHSHPHSHLHNPSASSSSAHMAATTTTINPVTMSLPTPVNSISTHSTDTPITDRTSPRDDGGGEEGLRGPEGMETPVPILPVITPAFLSGLLMKMRELRVVDVAAQGGTAGAGSGHRGIGIGGQHQMVGHQIGHGHVHVHGMGTMGMGGNGMLRVGGRGGVAVNKMLERTQAAG
ncbi:hypothetical protein D9756_001013 [Leucocoprinus leucothites]|uniref:Cyclin-like domain-containing protein n=1 Tax=Leucocoprinus leucothites TaxID=201217 RepID=A0A8H5GE35_9AGAR|nr:hypothetical protein D9756_001013 [Leucoagaricus leucothites]